MCCSASCWRRRLARKVRDQPQAAFRARRHGPGGFPGGEERKLVAQFDKDGDKRLNASRAQSRA